MNLSHSLMRRRRSSAKGSVTIEAAMAVPLFLFAVLCLLYLLEFHAISTTIYLNGMEVAKDAADDYLTVPFLPTYKLHRQLVNQIGSERLEASIIAGGANGLKITAVERDRENDELLILLTYHVEIPVPQFISQTIERNEEFHVKIWSGDKRENTGVWGEVVYVAATGQVYHKRYSCSHLQLSIQFALLDGVGELRNQDGGRYYPCERCRMTAPALGVYITTTGNRYHSSLTCSGLKRSIRSVYRHEVPWLASCSRCD